MMQMTLQRCSICSEQEAWLGDLLADSTSITDAILQCTASNIRTMIQAHMSRMMAGPEREHLNYGGKIMLPPSALDKLSRLHVTYPMMFELTNGQKGKMTHAGVLEFVAEEGKVYMPNWVCPKLAFMKEHTLIIIDDENTPARNR
jgi:hypothetical protein